MSKIVTSITSENRNVRVLHKTIETDGLKVFYWGGWFQRRPSPPAFTRLSVVIAHVPRVDANSCFAVSRHRSQTKSINS
jgi:hypothetical protein